MNKDIGNIKYKGDKIIITINSPKSNADVKNISVFTKHDKEGIERMGKRIYKLFELLQTEFHTYGAHTISLEKNKQIIIKIGVCL